MRFSSIHRVSTILLCIMYTHQLQAAFGGYEGVLRQMGYTKDAMNLKLQESCEHIRKNNAERWTQIKALCGDMCGCEHRCNADGLGLRLTCAICDHSRIFRTSTCSPMQHLRCVECTADQNNYIKEHNIVVDEVVATASTSSSAPRGAPGKLSQTPVSTTSRIPPSRSSSKDPACCNIL